MKIYFINLVSNTLASEVVYWIVEMFIVFFEEKSIRLFYLVGNVCS